MGNLRRWHRWIGLAAAVFLITAAASGLLLVYKKSLVRWLVTSGATLPADYGPAQMGPELDRIVGRYPSRQSVLIKAPNPEEPYWALTDEGGHQQLLRVGTLTPYADSLQLLNFFSWVRELHTELYLGVAGEWLLLACAVSALALTVIGFMLWWPARRSFRWYWVLSKPTHRRQLLQYHRHAGVVATLMLLIVMLSASIMLWQMLVSPLLPPVTTTTVSSAMEINHPPDQQMPSMLLAAALNQIPDGRPTYIRLPSAVNQTANFRVRLPGEWHPNGRTAVTINRVSGVIAVSKRSDQVSTGRKLLYQTYPLHSGYGMNSVYQLLILISGVALLWLCVTGIYSYLSRWRRRSH